MSKTPTYTPCSNCGTLVTDEEWTDNGETCGPPCRVAEARWRAEGLDPLTGLRPGFFRFRLAENGESYETVEDTSLEGALDQAEANFDSSCYGEVDETTWVTITATQLDSDGDPDGWESRKIEVDPLEPDCSADEHDWQSPLNIVGGCKENPGVWGSGGGVRILEVCVECGCARSTNTWAQDPTDGEQGLRSVKFEPWRFADEVAALRAEEDGA